MNSKFCLCNPVNLQGSIEEWLRLLRLEEYVQPLFAQGYATVRDVTQLPWEDMEDIGIVKLGHQKKLLLAIKRVKDIMSGKWVLPGLTPILSSSQVSAFESYNRDSILFFICQTKYRLYDA